MGLGTNSQKVQQLAHQLGGRINDRAFFTAAMTEKYFSDMVMMLVKKFSPEEKVGVHIVWEDDMSLSAYTTYRDIVVNANWNIMKNLNRSERFLCIHGMICHETAHILYTDVKFRQLCMRKMQEESVLWPIPDVECPKLKQILSEKKHTQAFLKIWNHVRNVLEDGYVEYTFLEDYPAPRFKDGLMFMRKRFLAGFEPLPVQIQKETGDTDILFTVLNILLEYAKFGELPYTNRKEQSDERIQAVVQAIPYIDDVNMSGESEAHYRSVNNVFASLERYIVPYLNSLPSEEEAGKDRGKAGSESNENGVPQIFLQKLTEQAAHGGLIPYVEDDGTGESDAPGPIACLKNRSRPSASGKNRGNAKSQEEKKSRKESTEEAEMITKRLLNRMAEQEAKRQLEKEMEKHLQEENSLFTYSDIHNDVVVAIERNSEVTDHAIQAYEDIRKDIERLANAAAKGIRQELKNRRTGGVQRGLYYGKSVSISSFSRYDKKYFQNKSLPTCVPLLSLAVVIDESGSMCGKKIQSAKIMALVVYSFCMQLGIRLMIVGHTADHGHVTLTTYCDFGGSFDNNDIYRIMDIHSKSCNRDGYANRYAVEKLRKEQSDMKLCIIISDGAPNDSGYRGQIAWEDIRKVKRDAQNHHIGTVVAAIDDDKEQIRKIYGNDSFLDITDPDQLPKAIVSVIKKYLPGG